MRGWLSRPAPTVPAAVGARQGLLLAVGLGAVLAAPIGLSVGLLVVVGSWTIGAWWWAVQLQEPVPREVVRNLSVRVGLGWGLVVATAYGAVGLVPGQLDLPWTGLLLASCGMGGMGAMSSGGLTLCGMDAGRAVAP